MCVCVCTQLHTNIISTSLSHNGRLTHCAIALWLIRTTIHKAYAQALLDGVIVMHTHISVVVVVVVVVAAAGTSTAVNRCRCAH